MKKELTIINEPLLSINKVHVCFYSWRHCMRVSGNQRFSLLPIIVGSGITHLGQSLLP